MARQGFSGRPHRDRLCPAPGDAWTVETVKLTPTEYRLLAYLATNANRVISHRELLRAVWGPEYGEETEYLRVYVRYLRQKLEPTPSDPQYLLTQPGAGYMLFQPEAKA